MASASAPTTHPTRAVLLDAGVVVAEKHGLAGLSVNLVVAQAGVAKGTFYVHFADRDAFIDALHERFHDHVRDALTAATSGVPPGVERIVRGAEAYLDVCLADRGVKALAVEAALTLRLRARWPRGTTGSRRPLSEASRRWAGPSAASSIAADDAGRDRASSKRTRLPAARRSLRRFLGA